MSFLNVAGKRCSCFLTSKVYFKIDFKMLSETYLGQFEVFGRVNVESFLLDSLLTVSI